MTSCELFCAASAFCEGLPLLETISGGRLEAGRDREISRPVDRGARPIRQHPPIRFIYAPVKKLKGERD